jgi:phospholipid-binding lipoprotein MlaA
MFKQFCTGRIRVTSVRKILIISVFLATGCASTDHRPDNASNDAKQIDPYENFNRPMYSFNMGLDKYVFKPVADGYKFITPDLMETGVTNFFNNLRGINVVLNDMLQGKLQQAGADTGRFLTNTTIGVAGLFDVASEFGLKQNVEDFGQTLAVWGVEDSNYLVLPFMGPTTVRDGSGVIFDRAANPGSYVPFVGVLEGINERANAEGAVNFINEAALDPYVFTRESFLQYRRNLIKDGKTDASSYDAELEASMEDVTKASVESGKVIQPAADNTANTGASNPTAFDSMLLSFEEASLKMDQLAK